MADPLSPTSAVGRSALRAVLAAATDAVEFTPGYVVTRDGRVFSIASNWRGYGPRELAQHQSHHGYLQCKTMVGRFNVHRLVAVAFHGPPPSGCEVCHVDGNRLNNAASNLRWGTAKENAADRERHGRTARGDRNAMRLYPEFIVRGEANRLSRMTEAQVRALRARVRAGATVVEAARVVGVGLDGAYRAARGDTWTHLDDAPCLARRALSTTEVK